LVAISITEPGAFHDWNPIKPEPDETAWPEGYFESWEPVGDDFQVPERLREKDNDHQEPPAVNGRG
jgi:hypothetical protein